MAPPSGGRSAAVPGAELRPVPASLAHIDVGGLAQSRHLLVGQRADDPARACPTTSDRSGMPVPRESAHRHRSRHSRPTTARFITIALMPIERTVADRTAVQHRPDDRRSRPRRSTSGKPASVCSTAPSWMFDRAPIVMGSLSPRMTAPNQTDDSASRTTEPTSTPVRGDVVAVAAQLDPALAERIAAFRVTPVALSGGQECDVAVPGLDRLAGIVGVGQDADVGERPGSSPNARLKSSSTLRVSISTCRRRPAPVAATTIWTRLVCGFAMIVPTGVLFDQM